ncbi:MAG: phosphotransferase [Planctomycetota bacterium]
MSDPAQGQASNGGFEPGELRAVLRALGVEKPDRIRPLTKGDPRNAKALIEVPGRSGVLKRLPRFGDDRAFAARVAFRRRLREIGLPVPAFDVVVRGGVRYELVEWVAGSRYASKREQAGAAGAQLALFHSSAASAVEGLKLPSLPRVDDDVEHAIARLRSGLAPESAHAIARLERDWHESRDRAQDLGLPLEPLSPVHGDYHPGNLIYEDGSPAVSALLDFDRCGVGSPLTELCSASLFFALRRRGLDPAAWSSSPDAELLESFWTCATAGGATEAGASTAAEAAPWLMILSVVRELIPAVATLGSLGTLGGEGAIGYAAGLTQWLAENSRGVSDVLAGRGGGPGIDAGENAGAAS